MSALAKPWAVLPATSAEAMDAVCAFEEFSLRFCEQVEVPTVQLIHAGTYARTIEMAAGVKLTGALMKIPTVLIVCGHVKMLAGAEFVELKGYSVIPAAAGRKQFFEAIERTWITMLFPTQAKTVEEAEAEFTDEAAKLLSRRQNANRVVITEE
ncbi:MAG TPA: hypothetical protein VGR47_05955 [Terracidiphilus sp.]|nr:hypothetical protein [Terracidiphilus sp.]